MHTQPQGHQSYFSAFYDDNSILIQFIIEELIQAFQMAKKIKATLQECFTSPSSLLPIFNQLVGYLPQQEYSAWTNGPLTKMKVYAEHYSWNASHQNKGSFNFLLIAHQAWLTIIHHVQILNSSPHPFFIPFLKRAFQSLQVRLNQIIRFVPKMLNEYWDKENVIFYLFRKKEELTEIYGIDFLHQRFHCPRPTTELVEGLIKSYQSKGFESLVPVIQQFNDHKAG